MCRIRPAGILATAVEPSKSRNRPPNRAPASDHCRDRDRKRGTNRWYRVAWLRAVDDDDDVEMARSRRSRLGPAGRRSVGLDVARSLGRWLATTTTDATDACRPSYMDSARLVRRRVTKYNAGQNIASLFFTMGRPFPPQNCPFPWGGSRPPSNTWFLGPLESSTLNSQPRRHLDRCSRFCRAH